MTHKDEQRMRVIEHALEIAQVTDTFHIRNDLLVSMDKDILNDTMKVRIEKMMTMDHIADDVYTGCTTHEWPATTWQMFKHRHQDSWWFAWFVDRYPVHKIATHESVQVQIDRYLAYPEHVIDVERLGRPVIYERLRELDS